MENEENLKCNCSGEDPKLNEILEQYIKDKSNLIQILNDVQNYYGYIPEKAQRAISEYLSIPMAEIYGVITFYSRFTLKRKISYCSMLRYSLFCKRFRKNIR